MDHVTLFDAIAGAVLLLSALSGFLRGATRELTSFLALVIAAAIAIFALRFTAPMAREVIDPEWAGTAVALLGVFLFFYILLRIFGGRLTEKVKAIQSVGILDRTVGLGFGVIRALVILGAFNMLFHMATPPEREPRWVTTATLYPLTEGSARVLRKLLPEGMAMAGKIGPVISDAVHEGASTNRDRPKARRSDAQSTKEREVPPAEGYDDSDRKAVDELVEKSR